MLDKEKNIIETPSVPHHVEIPLPESPRKRLIPSFIAGLQDFTDGESYRSIFAYFLPEFISALMLTSFLNMCDALWIAKLKSTSTYATLNVTTNFIHFMLKVAEGLTIGSVVLCGQYNGLTNYKTAGRVLRDVFWINVVVGCFFSSILFFGAPYIYAWYGVPERMIALGTPYLKLQAARVFLMFIYLSLVGFLRGIKNTRIPMYIFIAGGCTFLFFDYALIHGNFGFPAMHLQGSALASIIQYALMSSIIFFYLLLNQDIKKYEIQLWGGISSWHNIKHILNLSWPTIIDKATLAASYIWLGSLITPMGKYAIASFGVIKDLERFALIPAAAFAQVITFLVSNAYGVQDWKGIKSNIKKILFLSSTMVLSILAFFSFNAHRIIPYFDHKTKFTAFSAGILPYLSMLAFFDVLQLILSGALRGASNVKIVMMVRVGTILCIFLPLSYVLSKIPMQDSMVKFFLIYSSFYVVNAIMSIMYVYRLRGEKWKENQIA